PVGGEVLVVIARSRRVRAKRGPTTGSCDGAIQLSLPCSGLLRFARNDAVMKRGHEMTIETIIDTGTEELLCVIRERVAIITLNRPQARNSLSDQLTPALRRMIRSCGDDPAVGALLITGAGTAFCSGGDVKGMGAHRDKKKLDMTYEEKVADL